MRGFTGDAFTAMFTSVQDALPGGAEMSRALRQVFVERVSKRPEHLASLCYHYGKTSHFYVWIIHLLEDPETQVQRLPTDNPILDTLSGRFELGDRERSVTLTVRFPKGTHAHSRRCHLVFDRQTGLLRFMRYRVTNFQSKVYAWQKLERWSPVAGADALASCSRRAVVLQGKSHPEFGSEIPYSMKFDTRRFEFMSWLPTNRRFVSAAKSARGQPDALVDVPA